MSNYVDEINNIEIEMKRLRKRLKQLRELKMAPSKALQRYMVANNLKIYKGIKIEKITPTPKILKKTPSKKKKDALIFFREAGVGDPETFYRQYLLTQKMETPEL